MKSKMLFTPEDVEAGLMYELVDFLIDFNLKSDDLRVETTFYTDGLYHVVEWELFELDFEDEEEPEEETGAEEKTFDIDTLINELFEQMYKKGE